MPWLVTVPSSLAFVPGKPDAHADPVDECVVAEIARAREGSDRHRDHRIAPLGFPFVTGEHRVGQRRSEQVPRDFIGSGVTR
jgi:hypothetical protein